MELKTNKYTKKGYSPLLFAYPVFARSAATSFLSFPRKRESRAINIYVNTDQRNINLFYISGFPLSRE